MQLPLLVSAHLADLAGARTMIAYSRRRIVDAEGLAVGRRDRNGAGFQGGVPGTGLLLLR